MLVCARPINGGVTSRVASSNAASARSRFESRVCCHGVVESGRRNLPSHTRRFVPDCEHFKTASKSQFILTILYDPIPVYPVSKSTTKTYWGENFCMPNFWADFAESRLYKKLSFSAYPSLSLFILIYPSAYREIC